MAEYYIQRYLYPEGMADITLLCVSKDMAEYYFIITCIPKIWQ